MHRLQSCHITCSYLLICALSTEEKESWDKDTIDGSFALLAARARLIALQVVLACVEEMCTNDIIRGTDSVVIHTCNGDVSARCCCLARSYKHNQLVESIRADPRNTGQTRLWDGILTSLYDMQRHAEVSRVPRVVLLLMLGFTIAVARTGSLKLVYHTQFILDIQQHYSIWLNCRSTPQPMHLSLTGLQVLRGLTWKGT